MLDSCQDGQVTSPLPQFETYYYYESADSVQRIHAADELRQKDHVPRTILPEGANQLHALRHLALGLLL